MNDDTPAEQKRYQQGFRWNGESQSSIIWVWGNLGLFSLSPSLKFNRYDPEQLLGLEYAMKKKYGGLLPKKIPLKSI